MKAGLYLVATPIGNRDDISIRALDTLKNVDMIACEDTRHSSLLLSFFGIKKKLISLHQHNEEDKATYIASLIQQGYALAYISDAGTPAISDPGALLVRHMHNLQINVVPIPGPSALVTAFSVSGFPTNNFLFYGFLPNANGKCKKALLDIYQKKVTAIIYESPHRIIKTLELVRQVFGEEHEIVITRELTKIFETIYKGCVGNLITEIESKKDNQKGEFVLILSEPNDHSESSQLMPLKEALEDTLNVVSLNQSVKIIAKIYNKNKKEIYNLA
ncbi:MAG: 16S rRNA (cytidine(1402)-2'-O)-methyltransferase, partial [Nitrosomonadales bacterium]|nr:16S rRNA (cytidine(1402)-2'-O)-methyltransferase [Nitrosomonadales bacterium]